MLSHRDFLNKYELLEDEEHILVSKTANEILCAAADGESFVLYLGFDSCPWCQTFTPLLNAQAKEQHIREIWYWDIKSFRGNGAELRHAKEYLQILDLVGLEPPKAGAKGVTGSSRISVPFVAVINEGSIELFAEPPIEVGRGKLMRDFQGRELGLPLGDPLGDPIGDPIGDIGAIRYQDGFMLKSGDQVLGAYMWDDLLTGHQVPADFENRTEWLNQPVFKDLIRKNLRILLNISFCGLCSQ